jgi:hypothetical protein
MSPGETAARQTVKDVDRHRTDDMWEGDNGEQVGTHEGRERIEEHARECVRALADWGLVMCLMLKEKFTLEQAMKAQRGVEV